MVHGTTSHPFPYLRGYCFIAVAGGIVAHPPIPPCSFWGIAAHPQTPMLCRHYVFSLAGRISSCHPKTPNLKGEILCIWKTCRNPSKGYHCRKVKSAGGTLSALRLSFPKPQDFKWVSKTRIYKGGSTTLFPRHGGYWSSPGSVASASTSLVESRFYPPNWVYWLIYPSCHASLYPSGLTHIEII